MTTFLCVRHAQTLWNQEHRLTGASEVALAPAAERQIGLLTRCLLKEPIGAIFSSPLSRCQKTVESLAEILQLPVQTSHALIERQLGEWEGKTVSQISIEYPLYHYPESAYENNFNIPGAESISEVELRLRLFLSEVQRHYLNQTVLLSTHSGVIWILIHHLVVNPPDHFMWPGNTSITRISFQADHYQLIDFKPGIS